MLSSSLTYTIIVTGPAYGAQSSFCAYQFCKSLVLNSNASLKTVFFYADGAYNANLLTNPANDEFNLITAWQDLAKKHQIKLQLCASAAFRRGVTDQNLAKSFELVGLTDLSHALSASDRVIEF